MHDCPAQFYEPKQFPDEEKIALCSPNSKELGGPPTMVSNQFFNEIKKRDIGRQMCVDKGCTHFMSMDTDEFYTERDLALAKKMILENNLEGTTCKMRFYFKEVSELLLLRVLGRWSPCVCTALSNLGRHPTLC